MILKLTDTEITVKIFAVPLFEITESALHTKPISITFK